MVLAFVENITVSFLPEIVDVVVHLVGGVQSVVSVLLVFSVVAAGLSEVVWVRLEECLVAVSHTLSKYH